MSAPWWDIYAPESDETLAGKVVVTGRGWAYVLDPEDARAMARDLLERADYAEGVGASA